MLCRLLIQLSIDIDFVLSEISFRSVGGLYNNVLIELVAYSALFVAFCDVSDLYSQGMKIIPASYGGLIFSHRHLSIAFNSSR